MAMTTGRGITLKAFMVLLVAVFLGAAGQLMMKYAINSFQVVHGEEFGGLAMLIRASLTWGVLTGIGCYILSTVLYLRLMWEIPVSLLYPMVAVNYVCVTILGAVFLHETVPVARVYGLLLIISGVLVYAIWGQPPEESSVDTPTEAPSS